MTQRIYIVSPLISYLVLFTLVVVHLGAVVFCTALYTSSILGLMTSLFGCSALHHPHRSACCKLSMIMNTPSKSVFYFGQYDTRINSGPSAENLEPLRDKVRHKPACCFQHHAILHLSVGLLGIHAVGNQMSEKRSWHTRVSMQ
jgi:hypothetical protein